MINEGGENMSINGIQSSTYSQSLYSIQQPAHPQQTSTSQQLPADPDHDGDIDTGKGRDIDVRV